MTYLLLRRFSQLAIAVIGVVTVTFFALRLSGDPAALFAGDYATPEVIAGIRESMGLNDPLIEQYWNYVSGAARGDFGMSVRFGLPAAEVVMQRIPATLLLASAALALAVIVGVPAGVLAAVKRGTVWDHVIIRFTLFGQATPTFVLGILLIYVVAVTWRLLPTSGIGGWEHLVLPAITLGTWEMARIARLVRSSMLDILDADYIRTARGKGLGEPVVIIRHALSNGMLSAVTVISLSFATLLGGAIITETIFSWPGVGSLLVEAVQARDYAVMQTTVLAIAIMVAVLNFATDLTYTVIDPRIRSS